MQYAIESGASVVGSIAAPPASHSHSHSRSFLFQFQFPFQFFPFLEQFALVFSPSLTLVLLLLLLGIGLFVLLGSVSDSFSDSVSAIEAGQRWWSFCKRHADYYYYNYYYNYYYGRGWSGCKLPPGSKRVWPLVGETVEFLQPHSATSHGAFIDKHIQRYGTVFSACLFGHPTIVSADAELNRFILANEGRLFQCSYPSSISGILGRWSMLVLSGDEHRRMRSIALDFLGPHRLRSHAFLADIERHVGFTLGAWPAAVGRVLAQHEARKFTFELMARQIVSFAPSEPRTSELMRDYYAFMRGVVALPINLPGTAYRKAIKSRAKILDTLRRTLRERAAEEHDDLLSAVMKSGSLSADDQVLDLVLNMLFAGHETSSVALALALRFLADSPEAVRELKAEHRSIRGAMGSDGLSWDDYKKMAFTQCVINETLRLGNVVRFVHRKALRDVRFKGFIIPEGWKVLPMFCSIHLDPSVYKDPLKFDPWRWQECTKSVHFSPFGGGSRLCAGADLAKLEMAFFIHHLVLQFDWELAEPDNAMAYPYVEFEKGLPLRVRKLHQA